jgi:hypothetical protein
MSVNTPAKTRRTGWFTSTRSNDGSQCVEVRFEGEQVLVRDSKYLRDAANDPDSQPIIEISVRDWPAFLAAALGQASDAGSGLPTIKRHTDGGATLFDSNGTTLEYTPGEWDAFIAGVADGEFEVQVSSAAA